MKRLIWISFLAFIVPVSVAADVVVARKAIQPGTLILREDIALAPGTISGGADSLSAVIGQEAMEVIYPGHPVMLSAVRPAAVFERNERVEMRFRKGPLVIVTDGRALRRGHVGRHIPVLNLSSKTTVLARVNPDGSVEVGR
jgi:flagella basal body P-ring formation protein FlgA